MQSLLSFRRRSARLAVAAAALFLAACSSDESTAPAEAPLFSTMVVFGASLDDVGNVCNQSPAACPPAPYFSGRASNGTLWVELVAQRLGATATPARTGGTNYAYSGARTGPIAGTTQGVPNMIAQVDAYLAAGAAPNRNRALFVPNTATVGNDINDALAQLPTNPNAAAIPTAAVTNVVTMVQKLYTAGARHILVLNSTDVGKTPLVRANGAAAMQLATQFSTLFNGGLDTQLATLRTSNPGLTLYLVDLGRLTADVLAAPQTFGFSNGTTPCLVGTTACAQPDGFFYWDGFHPTAATGRLVSQRALTALGR